MASTSGVKSLYASTNKADATAASKERDAGVEAKRQKIITQNPGRKPGWSQERLDQMDRLALEERKRCIMWDDEGAGFYLMMNWDWLTNKPAKMSQDRAHEPGWFDNVKTMLRPPLLDPSVPEERLAAWIDSHTMHVHQFLDKLDRVTEGEKGNLVITPEPSTSP